MARINLTLDLDTYNPGDAELLGKLTLALGGNNQNVAESVAFAVGSMTKEALAPSTAFLSEAMITKEFKTEELEKAGAVSEYTEDELKAIPNEELKVIASSLGIEWAATEGKNTNAKLAKLILRHFNSSEKEEDKDTSEKEENNDTETDMKEDKKKSKSTDSEITLDVLKVELGAKVDANRDAIVAKLNELGATKLTNLDESHFITFMDFLKSL